MQLLKGFLLIFVSGLFPSAHLIAGELPFRSLDSTASASMRDLDEKLIKAIMSDDAKAVKALIAAGADVNVTDYSGEKAIELAGQHGASEAFRFLFALEGVNY